MQTVQTQVSLHNDLVRSSWKLSKMEFQLVSLAISRTFSRADTTHTITVAEYRALCPTPPKNCYQSLRNSALSLKRREIWLYPLENSKNITARVAGWVAYVDFLDQLSSVTLTWNPGIIDFLVSFRENFTQFNLTASFRMKSFHSMRLYWLLASKRSLGVWEIPVKELKTLLGVQDSYPLYKNFSQKVLKPALNDINANKLTEFSAVTLETVTTGKKIQSLIFKITPKFRPKLSAPAPQTKRAEPFTPPKTVKYAEMLETN